MLGGDEAALLRKTAHCRLWVLQRTAVQGGHGGPLKHIMMKDVTGIEICLACLSVMTQNLKETLETFKLREYQLEREPSQP